MRPSTSADTGPARVSKVIFGPAIPFKKAKRETQRPPLPHISTSPPSALRYRHPKSYRSDLMTKITPSAPTDSLRLQVLSTKRPNSSSLICPFLLSIKIKSFPLPFIFQNSTVSIFPQFRILPCRSTIKNLESSPL